MISGLHHITLSVSNVGRAFKFYREILGFKPLARWKTGAYFLLEDSTWFCLNFDKEKSSSVAKEDGHVAFSVGQENFRSLSNKILEYGTGIWSENKSEGDSLYFLDSEGNKLEIHVGDWQSRAKALKDRNMDGVEFF